MPKELKNMFAVLRQRNFSVLWVGQIISLIGDWVLFVALPFYIYSLTGSTFATGIMFIVQTIPRLCFGSVAGVFVDRWNRKYTMLITDLIQACVLLPLLLVRSSEWIWIIYLFAFVENTVSQFFIPAKTAIIPQLVDEQHLLAANSLNSTSQELTRLVGPFLGGVLFGLFGLKSVIVVDASSFLISALMISLIVLPPRPASSEKQEQRKTSTASLAKVWHEWLAGMRLVRQERLVAAIFIVIGVAMIGEGIIEVVLTGYVSHVLHGTALVLGWLMSAQAIGGIIGSLLIVRLSKLVPLALLIPLCGLVLGGLLIVMALVPVLAVILPLIAIAGVSIIGFFVSQITLLQSSVRNEYQGRVFGAFGTLQAIAMLFGMGLASGLGDKVGIVPMVLIDAACNLLAALLAFALIRSALRAGSVSQTAETISKEPAVGGILLQESLNV
jgi:MFS family permease